MTDVQSDNRPFSVSVHMENNRLRIREQLLACVGEYFRTRGEVATCSFNAATVRVTQ